MIDEEIERKRQVHVQKVADSKEKMGSVLKKYFSEKRDEYLALTTMQKSASALDG